MCTHNTTVTDNAQKSSGLISCVKNQRLIIWLQVFICSCLLAFILPASAVAQSTPSDSEKQMIEEAGKLFVFLSSLYKNGNPDIDYVLSRFKDDDRYRFMDTDSQATYKIENIRFRESFGHRMILRLNKSMYQITLGPGTTHLFDFWNYQVLWRLGKAGMLTTDKIEKIDDSESITHIYHPPKSDATANWQIRLRSIPDEGGTINARFTAERENDDKRK